MRAADRFTLAAIFSCAFVAADVAHEGIGHGGAYLALGGRSFVLSTTRVTPNGPGIDSYRMFLGQPHAELSGRLFSIAGPAGSFLLAAMCLAILSRKRLHLLAKLFCWSCAAFSLFWACGYIPYSILVRAGDYFELINGLPNEFAYRVFLAIGGSALYVLAARLLRQQFALLQIPGVGNAREALLIVYLSAAITASLAAALDPRGPTRIFQDALPETLLANMPILLMRRRLPKSEERASASGRPDMFWILLGSASLLFYVLVLGPGLNIPF